MDFGDLPNRYEYEMNTHEYSWNFMFFFDGIYNIHQFESIYNMILQQMDMNG